MALAVVTGDGHGLIPGAAVPQVDDLDEAERHDLV